MRLSTMEARMENMENAPPMSATSRITIINSASSLSNMVWNMESSSQESALAGLVFKLIAYAPYGVDFPTVFFAFGQLFTQTLDMHVHGTAVAKEIKAPNALQAARG